MAKAQKFLGWLHVNEHKPPENVELFVLDSAGKYHVAKWQGYRWWCADMNRVIVGVMYWALFDEAENGNETD